MFGAQQQKLRSPIAQRKAFVEKQSSATQNSFLLRLTANLIMRASSCPMIDDLRFAARERCTSAPSLGARAFRDLPISFNGGLLCGREFRERRIENQKSTLVCGARTYFKLLHLRVCFRFCFVWRLHGALRTSHRRLEAALKAQILALCSSLASGKRATNRRSNSMQTKPNNSIIQN